MCSPMCVNVVASRGERLQLGDVGATEEEAQLLDNHGLQVSFAKGRQNPLPMVFRAHKPTDLAFDGGKKRAPSH
jgi:hypothetical protein